MTNKNKQTKRKIFSFQFNIQQVYVLNSLRGLAGSVHDWQKETGRCTKIKFCANKRACLSFVSGGSGDTLSIIHRLNRLSLSIPRPSTTSSQRKTGVEGGSPSSRTFPSLWEWFPTATLDSSDQASEYFSSSAWTNDFAWSNTFFKGAINCDYVCWEKCCSPTLARWEILLCVI